MSRSDTIAETAGSPAIVHISDVHGYLDDARSALRAVGEADGFEPVVTADDAGRLHWAENDYALVINGDLIDRGPANEACLEMARRLASEAPAGRVRYHIGNHEMAILLPTLVRWPTAFSTSLDADARRDFLERILDGDVTAAFEGHQYVYSHAGSNESLDPAALNDDLQAAARTLLDEGDGDGERRQRRVAERHERLFGLGGRGGRGPEAGICWMDFEHLDASAPPQIVGHSRRARPVRKGNVVCGNVIRANQGSPGGEGVLVEDDTDLTAVSRRRDGGVRVTSV